MNSLPQNATADEIEEEILFARLLLETLDEHSVTYQEERRERERQLLWLESRLNMLRAQENASRLGLSQASPYTGGQRGGLAPPQTPATLAPPSRKRLRGPDDFLTRDSANKSLRSTPAPSPAATTPGTPNSNSSDPLEVPESGLNPCSLHTPQRPMQAPPTRNLSQYMEQHRQLEARAIQARRDAELARAWAMAEQARQQPQVQSTFGASNGFASQLTPPHLGAPTPPQSSKTKPSRTPFRPPPADLSHSVRSQPSNFSGQSAPAKSIEVIDLSGDTDDDDVQEIGFQPCTLAVRPHHNHLPEQYSTLGGRHVFGRSPPVARTLNSNNRNAYAPYGQAHVSPRPQQSWISSASNAMTAAGKSIYNTLQNGFPAIGGFINDLDTLDNQLVNGTVSSGSGTPLAEAQRGNPNVSLMFGPDIGALRPSSTAAPYPYPMPGTYRPFTGLYPSFPDPAPYNIYNHRGYPGYVDASGVQEDLKKMMANIRPDDDIPPNLREGTPEAMVHPLMEHQKLGLSWLKKMEEGSNKGGILADDMGLGKTIQALALIVSRPSEDPRRKTTLIIAPVALMRQWEREISTKLKQGRHALTVHVHHGSSRKLKFRELSQFDIVLTSYGTLAAEYSRQENWRKALARDEDGLMRGKNPEDLSLLDQDSFWYRVIMDEAQCAKNRETKTARSSYQLKSTYRWCMTGTPMMNKVEELFSLICFLRIPPYHEWDVFRREIKSPLEGKGLVSSKDAMKKLQAVLKAILLRRNKDSKIDGKPIFTLPPKTIEADHVLFDDEQQAFYNALETRTQLTFNKYLKNGSVGKKYSHILVLLLRLRQACCHPHLIRDFAERIPTDLTDEEMEQLAYELNDNVVARIKAEEGAFSCPICLDAVENPAIFLPCGHNTCSECFSTLSDPSRNIVDGSENATDLKCPNCRGKIDKHKIIDYRAFKRAHMPYAVANVDGMDDIGSGPAGSNTEEDEAEISGSDSSDGEEDEDETNSLDGFIVHDEVEGAGENVGNKDTGSNLRASNEEPKEAKTSSKKKKEKGKGKGKADDTGEPKKKKKKKPKTLAELRREGLRNKTARKEYFDRLTKDWLTSSKIDKTMGLLRDIRGNDPTEKTLIFSQFTSLLDLLEVPLIAEGMQSVRYDGSMVPNDRNNAVNHFIDSPTCNIMLISLKAGNAGLNLNAASQVILLDPFWNPYIEYQAIDRAHRLGQQRPVIVHRILVPDTVEDRIMNLQRKKEQLISTALDENAGKDIARLGVQELAYLFGVRSTLPQANGA